MNINLIVGFGIQISSSLLLLERKREKKLKMFVIVAVDNNHSNVDYVHVDAVMNK